MVLLFAMEMAIWHHWLDGRESEWTPGVGDGQGGLACCDSWGRKESDTTERLNWTELNVHLIPRCSAVKNLPDNSGDLGSTPGLGRSPKEKEMATHSSILAWEISWTEEPGGLQSMRSQKSRTRLSRHACSKTTGTLSISLIIIMKS